MRLVFNIITIVLIVGFVKLVRRTSNLKYSGSGSYLHCDYIKRQRKRCLKFFIILIFILYLGIFSGMLMRPRFEKESIPPAVKTLLAITPDEGGNYDFSTDTFSGKIIVHKNANPQEIEPRKEHYRGFNDRGGRIGDTEYIFSSVGGARGYHGINISGNAKGEAIFVRGNDYIEIYYIYTSHRWFNYLIFSITSPQYFYREKLDMADIASAEGTEESFRSLVPDILRFQRYDQKSDSDVIVTDKAMIEEIVGLMRTNGEVAESMMAMEKYFYTVDYIIYAESPGSVLSECVGYTKSETIDGKTSYTVCGEGRFAADKEKAADGDLSRHGPT